MQHNLTIGIYVDQILNTHCELPRALLIMSCTTFWTRSFPVFYWTRRVTAVDNNRLSINHIRSQFTLLRSTQVPKSVHTITLDSSLWASSHYYPRLKTSNQFTLLRSTHDPEQVTTITPASRSWSASHDLPYPCTVIANKVFLLSRLRKSQFQALFLEVPF